MSYLLGLLGHPVQHSLSPVMHKAALQYLELMGDYRLLDVQPDQLKPAVAAALEQGFTGLNVTVPHKQSMVELCAELTDEAKQARAVNTIKVDGQRALHGHNTDIGGFMSALAEALPSSVRRSAACIIGSGGAAHAAAWGLAHLGWPKIEIVARNRPAAQQIANELEETSGCKPGQPSPQVYVLPCDLATIKYMPDLVVNATPIGITADEPADWMIELLRWMDPDGFFFDMVYSSTGRPTPLISQATRLRLACTDGTDMLVQQAALSFEFWTGKQEPVEIMKKALINQRNAEAQKRTG